MVLRAAALYDAGTPCGAEANAAKYLAAEAAFRACERAVMTLGGMGYAAEYGVERLLREVLITRIAPVSPELIKCFIAERVLGLPKSYCRRLLQTASRLQGPGPANTLYRKTTHYRMAASPPMDTGKPQVGGG